MENLLGKIINGYYLKEILADEGLGVLFVAIKEESEQEVVFKIIRPSLTVASDFATRFNQEMEKIQHLSHPNILPILDFGYHDPFYYLILPRSSGYTLRQLIQQNSKGLPLSHCLYYFNILTETISYIHSQGIIHRNLKPENILLDFNEADDPTPQIWITDLGLVNLAQQSSEVTRSSIRVGTPAYMSPEQCRNLPITAASDIYGLGTLFFEIITGQPPYPIRSLIDAVKFHRQGKILSLRSLIPTTPVQLNALVRRMLSMNIERRPTVPEIQEKIEKLSLDTAFKPVTKTAPSVADELLQTANLIIRPPIIEQLPDQVNETDLDQMFIAVTRLNDITTLSYAIQDIMTIGRTPNTYIHLPHNSISKEHCQIKRKGNNLLVRDLNSTNGSFLDNTKLAPHTWYPWKAGSLLRLGHFTLAIKPVTTGILPQLPESQTIPTINCPEGQPPRYPLGPHPIILGRAPNSDMILDHRFVSKRHCQIIYENGTFMVTDLGSTNGTFYRDKRLVANQPVEWTPEFHLQIGPFSIKLEF